MRRVFNAIWFLLSLATIVAAEPTPTPVIDQPLPPPVYDQPVSPSPMNGMLIQDFNQPPATCVVPMEEPTWCNSPYRNSAWRVGIDFIPTVSDVSDTAFGEWDDNGGGLALRLSLGYEGDDGFGTRLQFWDFGQEADTNTFVADQVDLTASTFYWDFYKRFFIQDAELVFGGGLAGGRFEYELKPSHEKMEFSGGGLSMFAEGFSPFWRFEKTDIGSIGRARLASFPVSGETTACLTCSMETAT